MCNIHQFAQTSLFNHLAMMTKLLSIFLTFRQACAEFVLNARHSTMVVPSNSAEGFLALPKRITLKIHIVQFSRYIWWLQSNHLGVFLWKTSTFFRQTSSSQNSISFNVAHGCFVKRNSEVVVKQPPGCLFYLHRDSLASDLSWKF